MSDCVLDASALVMALTARTSDADTLRARLAAMRTHAPHLVDAEIGNVLRRHEQAGRISRDEAHTALWATLALVEHRYPHTGALAEGAWALRSNVSFYDALYVALAAHLSVPLVTADTRLSRAPALPCRVELV